MTETRPAMAMNVLLDADLARVREGAHVLRSMAEAYAAHGWPVCPLHSPGDGPTGCDCNKKVCHHPAKHPRTLHGVLDATTDLAKIARWWGMWPHANIGIATGAVSGLVVVDIDPRNGAMDTLAKLADEGKTFARTGQVLTHSGGWHLYYQHPGYKVPCKTNALGPGIDIKGDGGYVVAPPSSGVCGEYVWQVAVEELAAL